MHAPDSRLHAVFGGLDGSCTPGPIFSLPAHRPASGGEAAETPGAGRGRPAAGPGPSDSPFPRDPHSRRGTSLGGCGARRLHGLRALSRRPAPLGIHRRLPETPPWPRPALQLRARRSSRKGGGGVADSWWVELGKFVLSSDCPARGGAVGRELGPSCLTPQGRRRVTPTHP